MKHIIIPVFKLEILVKLDSQVVRGDFIVFFNLIFDALCKLSADSDANVQSAAHLLDRLVKVYISFQICVFL